MDHDKKIGSEVVHHNPWWVYKHDRFLLRDGREKDFYYGEKRGGAMVVARLADGRLILVRQYRHIHNRIGIEFPAGGLKSNETPFMAVRREFLEEAGATAADFINIGTIEISNSLFRAPLHIFLADGVTITAPPTLDPGEELEVMYRRPDEFELLIERGEIWHAATLAAWAMVRNRLLKRTL